jgi:hypothetical protein
MIVGTFYDTLNGGSEEQESNEGGSKLPSVKDHSLASEFAAATQQRHYHYTDYN